MVQTDSSSRFTVLLPIEQDGWHRTIVGLLEPQGVQTILAHSGREALDLIENTSLHAVVLDMQMPGLGGFQILKLMRELGKTIPVVLLAERLSDYLLREALGMRVFSVLSKPVDFNLLLDALARIIRRYHENRWPIEPRETKG